MIVNLALDHRYVRGILETASGLSPVFSITEDELHRAAKEAEDEGLARFMGLGYDTTTWLDESTTPAEAFSILEMAAAGRVWLWCWLTLGQRLDASWKESLGAWLLAQARQKLDEISARGFLVQDGVKVSPTLLSGSEGAPIWPRRRAARILDEQEDLQDFAERWRNTVPTTTQIADNLDEDS